MLGRLKDPASMFGRQKDPKSPDELIRRGDEYRIGDREEQNFEQALDYYKRASNKGSAHAQYLVGMMYESGHGVTQSYREAFKWYERSRDGGDMDGTCAYAFMMESGLGTRRNRAMAIENYETAARSGNLRAINNLGLIYKDKSESTHSDHAAVVWFQKANMSQFYPCQANLASMYVKGLDLKRDCVIGANIFKKAARQGSLFAKKSLAEMYSFGLGLPQSEEVSHHLYLEAARWGDLESIAFLKGEDIDVPSYSYVPEAPTTPAEQLAVGLRYLDGTTIGLSVASALFWIESAAKGGSTSAMYVLGQMYENGTGIEKSLNIALRWYKRGAEKGNGACAYNLAYLYEHSNAEDAVSTALALYKQSAESDADEDVRSDAYYSLGLFYSNGTGTEQSDEMALDALVRSADLGNAAAQYIAGRMFLDGRGTDVDPVKARRYLRMAADQGDDRAEEMLSSLD